ncbi:hypothetical protein [Lewinella sp. JB7]|uniref:hypothetical protein n=1 Tax=Lewinella sp. JB7 TaxID=2962887 RepID=UPI0020C9D182|nr:hypothetical protein [Lewinella sp. JB7]MCP9236744.1 hypothetical protein [Lewinella sp. JB7]
MTSDERIIGHPGLRPLWDSLEREHRLQQLTALGLVVCGLAVSLFTLSGSAVLPFLGMLVATLGVFWLVRLLGKRPAASWRERLREEPERIVWVFSLVTERMPFGLNLMRSGMLYLVDADGEMHDFSLKADHLLLVTKTLNRLLPHAEFGYTEERELKYRGKLTRFK